MAVQTKNVIDPFVNALKSNVSINVMVLAGATSNFSLLDQVFISNIYDSYIFLLLLEWTVVLNQYYNQCRSISNANPNRDGRS